MTTSNSTRFKKDTVKPIAYYREKRNSLVNVQRQETAREAIGPISKTHGFTILTNGCFDMIDAVRWILSQTGPARLCITTWVPGSADLVCLKDLIDEGRVTSLKFLLDYGFAQNKPERAKMLLEMFGSECIVETRNHSKVVLIRNEEWDYCLRESLNLNANKRCENLDGDNDKGMCDAFEGLFDSLMANVQTGLFRDGTETGKEYRAQMIAPKTKKYIVPTRAGMRRILKRATRARAA